MGPSSDDPELWDLRYWEYSLLNRDLGTTALEARLQKGEYVFNPSVSSHIRLSGRSGDISSPRDTCLVFCVRILPPRPRNTTHSHLNQATKMRTRGIHSSSFRIKQTA